MPKINSFLFITITIIILIGLFFILKLKSSSIPSPQSSSNAIQQATSSAFTSPNIKSFDLIIKNKKLVSGPETLQVTEGDRVTINITSDEEEELHLHGYDKSVDLEKDKPAKLEFRANLTGRFPYELEKSKTEIGALEVQPK